MTRCRIGAERRKRELLGGRLHRVAFFRILGERGGNIGSTTVRLLQLLDAVGAAGVEAALLEALERDAVHLGAIRQIVDRRRSERGLHR